jgi:hypothetical protein
LGKQRKDAPPAGRRKVEIVSSGKGNWNKFILLVMGGTARLLPTLLPIEKRMAMSFQSLDLQMQQWTELLVDSARIERKFSGKIATMMHEEMASFTKDTREELFQLLSDPIPIENRLEELQAFQGWMNIANNLLKNPCVTRAQIIVQNYICFVYLNDSCYKNLRKYASNGSVTKKCCDYLINNPIRAFRNAIAHSNWKYSDDHKKIIFYAKKGNSESEPMIRWEVSDVDLDFWQSLARCTAYTAYLTISQYN